MNYFKERNIPFYYLYDTKGTELFHQITLLEEYYPFNKEEEILTNYGSEIVEIKEDNFSDGITIVEFGAG